MRKLLVLLVGFAIGCNEIRECDLDSDLEYAVVAFYNASDSLSKEVAFKSLTISNISGTFGIDTAEAFAFNLDPTIESLTYFFETDSDTYDLTIDYNIGVVQIYYVDCEPSFRYSISSTSSNLFDSVALVGPIINKNIPINVEVYF